MRTARGRMATAATWKHFGLSPPDRPDDLFGNNTGL